MTARSGSNLIQARDHWFKIKKVCHSDRLISSRLTRFERATPTSAGWCSNPAELQPQIFHDLQPGRYSEATGVEPARPVRNRRISNPLYYRSTTLPYIFGAGGIRTPGTRRYNGFQDRLSTTALIPLQCCVNKNSKN